MLTRSDMGHLSSLSQIKQLGRLEGLENHLLNRSRFHPEKRQEKMHTTNACSPSKSEVKKDKGIKDWKIEWLL